jgi:hypothetical protein
VSAPLASWGPWCASWARGRLTPHHPDQQASCCLWLAYAHAHAHVMPPHPPRRSYLCTVVTTWTFLLVPFLSLMFDLQPVAFSRQFALAATLYLGANFLVRLLVGLKRERESAGFGVPLWKPAYNNPFSALIPSHLSPPTRSRTTSTWQTTCAAYGLPTCPTTSWPTPTPRWGGPGGRIDPPPACLPACLPAPACLGEACSQPSTLCSFRCIRFPAPAPPPRQAIVNTLLSKVHIKKKAGFKVGRDWAELGSGWCQRATACACVCACACVRVRARACVCVCAPVRALHACACKFDPKAYIFTNKRAGRHPLCSLDSRRTRPPTPAPACRSRPPSCRG